MKKLLLLALVLNLCSFVEAPAQNQTSARKKSAFSPHSKRTRFAKPPHSWLKEMEDDSSERTQQDERLRNSLPPHLRGMKNLPPHILAERQWLLQSEAENTSTGAAGLEPNNPLDQLYPPHKRPLTQTPNLLKNNAAQTLSGGVQEAWSARYDGLGHAYDSPTAMAIDGSGNIYVTGYSQAPGDFVDYLTVKYNAAGVKQWTARYNGPGNTYDIAVAVAVDGAGNVYVTGYSAKDFNGTSSDYVTVKYNSAGTQVWVAIYNGPGNGKDYAVALGIDAAGNIYVTGYSEAPGDPRDYLTVKYNSAGIEQWTARYNGPGNTYDTAVALTVDGASNIYVTGHSWNSTSSHDYVTVKYNSTGAQEWVAIYNGSRNGADFAQALGLDAAGNVYVTGYSTNSSGKASNYVTVIYNSSGILKWAKVYNGSGNGDDFAFDLVVDGAGNVYVTGDSWNGTSLDFATVKYNSAGTHEWVATYSGPGDQFDHARALVVDGAGNVYVTGFSAKDVYGSSTDYVTVKYSSAGAQAWVATYNGPENGNDHALALGIDAAGNVYVTGSSDTRINYYHISEINYYDRPDYATVKYSSTGQEQWDARHGERGGHDDDIATAMVLNGSGYTYIMGSSGTVKYNSAGIPEWVQAYEGSPVALAVDGAGNVYVTGYSVGLGTGYDYATLKYNAIGQEQWIARYNGPGNGDDEAKAIAVDRSGNVYVTGSSPDNDESYDYTTVKYNSVGKKQWVARYNGPNNWGEASALALDGAGNVYVTGTITGSGTGRDFATIKYNSAGQKQWVAIYNGPGNADDRAVDLGVDGQGNVYVTGDIVLQYIEADYGYIRAFYAIATVKYNSVGQQQWVAHKSGIEPHTDENWIGVSDLAVDGDGNVYVTGSMDIDQWEEADFVYITVKYNSDGQQQWSYGYGQYSNDQASALAVDNTGNVYVTGTVGDDYTSEIATFKHGTQWWSVNHSGPGNKNAYAVAIALDGAGNVYVAGSNYNANTGYDYVTIKYTQTPAPIANAGPDKEVCTGSSVSIGGNPTGSGGYGGPYSFRWSPTTGLDNPTVANPNAAPLTTTKYSVFVTETATGANAMDDVTVTVTLPPASWSVAHIVDVDDVIFGIDQGATTATTPRDNRGLALSPDDRFLYLGYTAAPMKRLVRKIDLSVSDPAHNHSAVVAQLKLPSGTQPARDIATDDKGRVYLALGTKIEVYNSDLKAPPLHTISGFTACEGVATRRANGALVVYTTDRLDKTLERFVLVEGTGEAITSSSKSGLDGDGEVRIIGATSPRGLDIASNGTVWIADLSRGKVYRVNSAGSTVDSSAVVKPMDVAIDETRGEVYVSMYTLRTLKVLSLSDGRSKRKLTPPAAGLNVDLDGADGTGALSGIDVASCQRVFVANERGRSILTGNPLDSPFSNVGDNNDMKAADTDPVLVVTGNVLAKEPEGEESEEEVAVAEAAAVTSYELAQNYPNPFSSETISPALSGGNPSTTIRLALPEAAEVSLKIYDVAGQLVQTLVNGVVEAGRHQVVWDGTNRQGVKVASGAYFYQLRAAEFEQVRKMSLVR